MHIIHSLTENQKKKCSSNIVGNMNVHEHSSKALLNNGIKSDGASSAVKGLQAVAQFYLGSDFWITFDMKKYMIEC